ncbi:hypothetical protein, conserved, partial [Eimeria tenella]
METFKRRPEGSPGALGAPGVAGGSSNGYVGGPVSSNSSSSSYGPPKRARVSGAAAGSGEEAAAAEGGPPVLPVCLLVSDNIAGALIGKGGSTVREFERTTGARIFVQRNSLGAPELAAAKQAVQETLGALGGPLGGPPQALDVAKIVAIGGPQQQQVQQALQQVLGLISSHPTHAGKAAAALLLVPQRSVGGLVGQRGKTIEELSLKSSTQIRIVPGVAAANGDRALCIAAQQQQHLAAAIQLLLQQLQHLLAARRIGPHDFEFLIALASSAQPRGPRGPRALGPLGPLGAPLPAVVPLGAPSPGGAPPGFFPSAGA